MKALLNAFAVCTLVTLVGCQTAKTSSVAPGAVSNGNCCADSKCCAGKSVAPGAVGDKAGCCKDAKAGQVSPGAVGETKSGCCAGKASCGTKN